MQHVLPAVRGLRTLYVLASDRVWFALAVAAGLVLAVELVSRLILPEMPLDRGSFGL
ncbi:MAG: hypothetical protein Kow0013_16840 [Pararhodobacter sp.]